MRVSTRRRVFSGLTLALAGFAVVNGIWLELALARAPWHRPQITTLHYTAFYLAGVAIDDSWRPMREALGILDATPRRPIYQELFFARGVKFQTPPTSLLPLWGLRWIGGERAISNGSLNALSSLAVALGVALVAFAFLRCAERSPRTASAGRVDRAARVLCIALLALTFFPLVRGYYLGQLQTWVGLLFAALVCAWITGRPGLAGALAGLACALKPTLGFLLAWGLVRRQLRFSAALAGALLVLAVGSGLLHGFEHQVDYLRLLSHIAQRGESFQPNQSPNGLANRLLGNGDPLVWRPDAFAPYHPAVHAITLASGIAFALFALFYRRGDAQGDGTLDLLLAAMAATIAAPIAWEHHYGIALVVFAVALPRTLALCRPPRGSLWLLVAAYVLVSHQIDALDQLAGGAASPVASYTLAGGLLLVAQLIRLRRAYAEVAPVPACP